MNRRDFLKGCFLFPFAWVPLFSCSGRGLEELKFRFKALGTICRVTLYGSCLAILGKAAREVKSVFHKYERILSPFMDGSPLSILNREARNGEFPAHGFIAAFLENSFHYNRMTRGIFDPTVGGMLKVLGRFGDDGLKGIGEKDYVKAEIGMDKVDFNRERGSVRFLGKGIFLDPCGLGKGMAVDGAVEAARSHGAEAGIVEAGGDLRVFGPRKFLIAQRIGKEGLEIKNVFPLCEAACATSGEAWDSFIVDPRKCSLLEPKEPVFGTVISRECAEADALATSLVILKEEGIRLLEGKPGIHAMVFNGSMEMKTKGFPGFRGFH